VLSELTPVDGLHTGAGAPQVGLHARKRLCERPLPHWHRLQQQAAGVRLRDVQQQSSEAELTPVAHLF